MNKLLFSVSLFVLATLVRGYGDVAEDVNRLIPKMASEDVESRYNPQMELKAIAAHASRPGAEDERLELAGILTEKAVDPSVPQPARVWIVRMLEYMGKGESVSALTRLLSSEDSELRECARRALEKNSDPAASASLRTALEKDGDARWKVGLINSLGERRDTEAVDLIAKNISPDKPEVGDAAVYALAKIASREAIASLQMADRYGLNPNAADALLETADRLRAEGESNQARPIYQQLYSSERPVALRAAALWGLLKTEPRAAAGLITEALKDSNPRLQQVAVRAVGELNRPGLNRQIGDSLPTLPPAAKVQVMGLLGRDSEPRVIEAARDENEAVSLAALEALGNIGGSSSLPVLINAAAESSTAKRAAARQSLARVSGPGISAEIQKFATQGEPEARAAAIQALEDREETEALPDLLKYARDPNPAVSAAALSALRKMGADNEMENLAHLLVETRSDNVLEALKAVAGRVQDESAAVKNLIALARATDPAGAAALLNVLSVPGGDEALAFVTGYLTSENADLQEGSMRSLSNWPDYSATKRLLQIASDENTKSTYNVLAIRGLVRLIKAADQVPADERVTLALATMEATRRVDEKKLVLSALGTIPHPKAIATLKPLLTDPDLQNEAGLAALSLANLLRESDPAAARDLAQAVGDADISRNLSRQARFMLRRIGS